MKIVRFKTLSVRNFLSVGAAPIVIDLQRGINAIVGSNLDKEDSRNGAGKSSLLCALNFALYGNTIRNVDKDHISNSITKKGAVVELLFEVQTEQGTNEYKVVRSLKPSKCTIYKDGSDETLSTIAKCNEFLSGLIRTPESVFQNSVILSLNHSTPFFALSKIDKRKYIESVMSLNAFTAMGQLVKEEYSQTKREYELRAKELNLLVESLEFNKNQHKEYKTKVAKQEARLQEIQTEIDKIIIPDPVDPALLEKLETKSTKLKILWSETTKELNDTRNTKNQKVRDITRIEQEIEELAHSTSCPTCKRAFDETTVSTIQQEIEKKKALIPPLRGEKDSLAVMATELETNINKLEEKETDLNKLRAEYAKQANVRLQAERDKKQFENLYEELKQSAQDWDFDALAQAIQAQELKIATLQTSVDKLNTEMLLLDAVKFVISEDGIKAFIIKKILQLLNNRIAYYLQKLQANCSCAFNELFEDDIRDELGESKSYFNFSGGERKRIDFACMFAFADIRRLQGDVVFETVFYDELLDTSLDDKGIELVLDILQERLDQYNESCYIVSHRTVEISTKADHVVKVEKKNGCTQLCD